jgi:FkbM family methyltransferase
METANAFSIKVFKNIIENLDNHFYTNNFQYYCTGDMQYKINDLHLIEKISKEDIISILKSKVDIFIEQLTYKSFLYSILDDEYSKNILSTLATYQILGHTRVKLPYYNHNHFKIKEQLVKMCSATSEAEQNILDIMSSIYTSPTGFFDLTPIDIPLTLYASLETVYSFHQKYPQYAYNRDDVHISVEPGDIVFDCGACLGDTALIFSFQAGQSGKIFSFEPSMLALQVFEANMKANPLYAKRISVLQQGTSDEKKSMYLVGLSSGAHCSSSQGDIEIECVTIDDTVDKQNLNRVDFIKMDIEGSELLSLYGAKKTLLSFSPKLAICLYHNQKDFHEIPAFLQSLDIGYKFYLDHYNVNNFETVLYAYTPKT